MHYSFEIKGCPEEKRETVYFICKYITFVEYHGQIFRQCFCNSLSFQPYAMDSASRKLLIKKRILSMKRPDKKEASNATTTRVHIKVYVAGKLCSHAFCNMSCSLRLAKFGTLYSLVFFIIGQRDTMKCWPKHIL